MDDKEEIFHLELRNDYMKDILRQVFDDPHARMLGCYEELVMFFD